MIKPLNNSNQVSSHREFKHTLRAEDREECLQPSAPLEQVTKSLKVIFSFLCSFLFKTSSPHWLQICCIAEDKVFLSTSRCWDYRHTPPSPDSFSSFIEERSLQLSELLATVTTTTRSVTQSALCKHKGWLAHGKKHLDGAWILSVLILELSVYYSPLSFETMLLSSA